MLQRLPFFSSCVHCGLCAQACLFYTETCDPAKTPIHKLEPMRRLWEQEYTLARIAHRSPGSGVFGRRDVAQIDR
ncbi:hypothetical protein [Thiolapillus sp.]|uniref:hypothetical protein n=1 Tax=Thiolapillus sp. TaxID=2017437 RepID=UPI003AF5AA1E